MPDHQPRNVGPDRLDGTAFLVLGTDGRTRVITAKHVLDGHELPRMLGVSFAQPINDPGQQKTETIWATDAVGHANLDLAMIVLEIPAYAT
jgi:hypothetical protein